MRILITGSNGQLGYYLNKVLKIAGNELLLPASESMDITDYQHTSAIISLFKPDIVIHAAAYTNVDGCETNADLAYKVNALGTRNIAIACNSINTKMLYISTDFVFDGTMKIPYTEFDDTNPLNVYGKSKLAGEEYVKALLNKFFIVRTSWLYGNYSNNFVKTIEKHARERGVLEVVDDQMGSPTYAGDLARTIGELIKTDYYGIYHCSNTGQCTWYEFANKILEFAGHDEVQIKPITSEELSRPAKRPTYSVLNNYMLKLQEMDKMPHWVDALKLCYSERDD